MNSQMRKFAAALLVCAMGVPPVAAFAQNGDTLVQGFVLPPKEAKPEVWWHWMSGNVSSHGAQLDLEWMNAIGIGGVHAFAGGGLEPTVVAHPLPFMSPGWRDAYREAVTTARRDGMNVTIAGSPGWSQTGGPWVKPADGMKKYVWSEIDVSAGEKHTITLPSLPTGTGQFLGAPLPKPFGPVQEVKTFAASGPGPIIAFPTPQGDRVFEGRYMAHGKDLGAVWAAPTDLTQVMDLPVSAKGVTVDIDLGQSHEVRSLTVAMAPRPAFTLLSSDNGITFRPIRTVGENDAEKPSLEQTFTFVPSKARYFRIVFSPPNGLRKLQGLPEAFAAMAGHAPSSVEVRRLVLSGGDRIDNFEAKAGFQSIVERGQPDQNVGGQSIVPESVIELSSRVSADGRLDWSPPSGRWTVLRFGWSLTGQTNGPAEPDATGPEVDKLDRVAVTSYLNTLLSKYSDDVGVPLGTNGIASLLTDSWEAGVQNWTPSILHDFKRLRGYDPMPWLPALAGRVVKSRSDTEGFLFDWRQTLTWFIHEPAGLGVAGLVVLVAA